MFTTIYKYELKHWIKQPSIYIYATLLFLLATGMMAGYAGVFDEPNSSGAQKLANSAINIHHVIGFFKELLLFLLPVVIGTSLYRDFRSNTHSILYSYPFKKSDYFSAKFFSGVTIVIFISIFIGIGLLVGTKLPGADSTLVGPNNLLTYLHEYFIYIIPNILFFGAIVFSVVASTRNIYSGFIAVFVIVATEQILGRIFTSMDSMVLFALFDPFGQTTTQYYTHLWTVTEQNMLPLPIKELISYNRLLWFSITTMIFIWSYKRFTFSQNVNTISLRKAIPSKTIKDNFGSIIRVKLPKVDYSFSFINQLKATWRLSNAEFKYIFKSGPFIVILIFGFLIVLFTLAQMNPISATKLLPVTWLMLLFPVFFFLMVVNLLTFLYAGMLIQRAKTAKMSQLVDASAVPNWVLLFSKVIALIKMQIILLTLIMIAGLSVQTFNGYYNYDIGHYIFHLFVVNLSTCIIWAFLAVFVQTIFTNPYLGLFFLMLFSVGAGELHLLGIEQGIFKFNQNPDQNFIAAYSELSGYGAGLLPYLIYKIYWILGGLVLLCGSVIMWVRGTSNSLKERLNITMSRLNRPTLAIFSLLTIAFISLGAAIYHGENTQKDTLQTATKQKPDKLYGKYLGKVQPRISSVSIDMEIYPETRSFKAIGKYQMINRSDQAIDTILVNYKSDVVTKYSFDKKSSDILKDAHAHFDILSLDSPLMPGDSLTMSFEVENISNTIFKRHSPIETNGTFLTSHMFAPGIGYQSEKFTMPEVSDSAALQNMYRAPDADFIDFEATVSTSLDQIAIAPGYLQKEWVQEDRRYFRYKSTSKVTNDYVFNSGKYGISKDQWYTGTDSVKIEIYHHPTHTYNLKRIMRGIKAGLEYNSKYFAPYQHKQVRIIEYSRSLGNYGQSYANTLPTSETSFVSDINTDKKGSIDKLFGGIAHEIAHQWWGHQAIPAGTIGYAMVTESMSEYVALKVTEYEYGKDMLRSYTKQSLKTYLKKRSRENSPENPLIYNHGQDEAHVPYEKGSLALYVLSDYLGEENFNTILQNYMKEVRFKNAPYTTAVEMSDFIKEQTPDSLKYLVIDLFEKVTLYDNKVDSVSVEQLPDGRYKSIIDVNVSKYRSGQQGSRTYSDSELENANVKSLPLSDYIEIGLFDESKELYLEKHFFNAIDNQLEIITSERPTKVAIDPYYLLIDANIADNYQTL